MKIYISGPISSDPYHEEKFKRAEKILRGMGHEPINPAAVGKAWQCVTYKEYLDNDLRLLEECDGIFMLRGWQRSKGARLEHNYAKTTGLWIRYQG